MNAKQFKYMTNKKFISGVCCTIEDFREEIKDTKLNDDDKKVLYELCCKLYDISDKMCELIIKQQIEQKNEKKIKQELKNMNKDPKKE
jgi:hypothetical protein